MPHLIVPHSNLICPALSSLPSFLPSSRPWRPHPFHPSVRARQIVLWQTGRSAPAGSATRGGAASTARTTTCTAETSATPTSRRSTSSSEWLGRRADTRLGVHVRYTNHDAWQVLGIVSVTAPGSRPRPPRVYTFTPLSIAPRPFPILSPAAPSPTPLLLPASAFIRLAPNPGAATTTVGPSSRGAAARRPKRIATGTARVAPAPDSRSRTSSTATLTTTPIPRLSRSLPPAWTSVETAR